VGVGVLLSFSTRGTMGLLDDLYDIITGKMLRI
jgi:hypothetical protein